MKDLPAGAFQAEDKELGLGKHLGLGREELGHEELGHEELGHKTSIAGACLQACLNRYACARGRVCCA